MPPPPRDSVAAEPRPLRLLNRDELGQAFADACKEALAGRRVSRGGGTLGWTRHPAVEEVLDEIRLRYLDELEALERQLSLLDALQLSE